MDHVGKYTLGSNHAYRAHYDKIGDRWAATSPMILPAAPTIILGARIVAKLVPYGMLIDAFLDSFDDRPRPTLDDLRTGKADIDDLGIFMPGPTSPPPGIGPTGSGPKPRAITTPSRGRFDEEHFGKKCAGGRYGHEFYPPELAGPHSRYIGYAAWKNVLP
jgi:hypothetical protein